MLFLIFYFLYTILAIGITLTKNLRVHKGFTAIIVLYRSPFPFLSTIHIKLF